MEAAETTAMETTTAETAAVKTAATAEAPAAMKSAAAVMATAANFDRGAVAGVFRRRHCHGARQRQRLCAFMRR
ncbi:hypothetical protein ABTD95_20100, partial [Acinetobacter baumannii]